MSKKIIVLCLVLLGVIIFSSCSYQRKVHLSKPGMPEEVFQSPRLNYYPAFSLFSKNKVAIFRFTDPKYDHYEPGYNKLGVLAAQYLYQELLRKNIFSDISLELNVDDISKYNLIDIARAKGYDIIISGDLLYYIDGTHQQASRVEEQINVTLVKKTKTETLWSARAVEDVNPAPHKDFILFEGKGASAPSGLGLMKRNAEKFANMFSAMTKK